MKVYIAGSGRLNGEEQATLIAVCIPEEAQPHLPTLFYKLRERLKKSADTNAEATQKCVKSSDSLEIRAEQLLRKELYERAKGGNPDALAQIALVEEIFQQLSFSPFFNPITIFGIIIPRLDFTPYYPPGLMPNQIRYLLQRVDKLIETRGQKQSATIYFDQDFVISKEESILDLRDRFTRAISEENSNDRWRYISSSPSFSKPLFEEGLQLADIIATCLKLGWQEKLVPFYVRPTWDRPGDEPTLGKILNDPFLGSLSVFLKVIFCHTVHLPPLYGIHAMSQRDFQTKPATGSQSNISQT